MDTKKFCCQLNNKKSFTLEYTEFCWEPTLEELTKAGEQLNKLANRLVNYFRIESRIPYVYVRNGNVAIGIFLTAIAPIHGIAQKLKKFQIEVTKRP